ncbi:MAG: M1 family metallopeptidase [Kofleriaceae bacterium]
MLRVACLVVLFGCGPATPAVSPTPAAPPVVPVPDGLAPPVPTLRLPRNFEPTGYAAHLVIDPARPDFTGRLEIAGRIRERSSVIWLHGKQLRIGQVRALQGANEIALAVTQVGDDLLEVRAATPLAPGAWTFAIDYGGDFDRVNTTGVFAQTVADQTYVFTKFEAIYARRVFPIIDEPDVKVPWRLTLDVPKQLVAVANTPIATETVVSATVKRVAFAPTRPLSSYLIAFAVGPFELVDAGRTRHGTPIRIITQAKRAADAAFAVKATRPLLDALEDWFGTPYPFAKLDLIAVPLTINWGAMENAGLITFNETSILIDPERGSKEREHRFVTVAAHELAHQWFGDLVTMKFWDDLWLNEGFANWLERKVTGVIDASYRDDQAMLDVRNVALEADGLVSARQIRQPVRTIGDISTAFDRITYDKGASVLAMFERYLGPQVFQRGVRDYLATRSDGNATSEDFAAAISKAAGSDVGVAFASFLEQPGAPEITATLSCSGDTSQLSFTQQRYVPPGAPTAQASSPWIVPICFAYDRSGARGEACTLLTAATGRHTLPVPCPRWVMTNQEGAGYYRTAYTKAQLTALRDVAWPKLSWLERRAVFSDLETAIKSGRLPLRDALPFVPKLLAGNDRFTLATVVRLLDLLEPAIPDAQHAGYEAWLRATFGARARKLKFLPRAGDSYDVEEQRTLLASVVGWSGRDRKLVAEAVRLAAGWRDLPQSIRGLVLQIAVDADPARFAAAERSLGTETDRARRDEIYNALARVRDPVRQQRALALVLDPAHDIRETRGMLRRATTEHNRTVARTFFRDHAAALFNRLPTEGNNAPVASFATVFTAACSAEHRDEIAAYVKTAFGPHVGGDRVVAQSVEAMDQCIARKQLLAPELRAWLRSAPARS